MELAVSEVSVNPNREGVEEKSISREGIQKGPRDGLAPKESPLLICFLQLGPPLTFYHLPIMPVHCDSIKGVLY